MKKLLALVLSLVLMFTLVACASTPEAETPTEAPEENTEAPAESLTFAFVSPLTTHPYWVTVEEEALRSAEELGVELILSGPAEVNVDEQIKAIETAIASKVDGILTMALDPTAFGPVIDKAVDAGIPVVLIDTDAPESKRSYYAGTSNFAAGQEAGMAMIEATGGEAMIGIITGEINQASLNQRIDGFKDAIKDQPGMEVLAIEPSNSDLLQATQKAQTLLQTYPEMDAMFGVSATDVQGAAKVVIERGMEGEVSLVGFDDMDDTLKYIREDVVYATVVQRNGEMGYRGIQLLQETIDGTGPAEDIIDTGVIVVTKENVDSYK